MAKIYVASSWRNKYQEEVVAALIKQGHFVYDFKHPVPGEKGFAWSDIDPNWQQWTPAQFRDALKHPIAQHGFNRDMDALEWCNMCLLVLPSGRSAHFEAGWTCGARKATAIYIPELPEPELMYKICELTTPRTFPPQQPEILISMDEVLEYYGRAAGRAWNYPPEAPPQRDHPEP